MVEEVSSLISGFIEMHENFLSQFQEVGIFIDLMLLILLGFLYALFIWKLHRFVATKNFLGKYFEKITQSSNEFTTKLIYLIEYLIISPFLIFFWFLIFSSFLILLTEIQEIKVILIISTIVIATTRMSSYYNEELAREIAKILPFTMLAISIINPTFFNIERVLRRLDLLPLIFNEMFFYLLFIIILEAILRFFGFIFTLFDLEEDVGN